MSTSATVKRQRAYVPTTALAKAIEFTSDMMQVILTDGRILSVPIMWFPSLMEATPEQRLNVVVSAGGRGLHWPEIDEDLSIAGLMAGVDQQAA